MALSFCFINLQISTNVKIILFLVFLLVAYILWRIYFLRDPKRNIPEGPVMVSPADGFVVYIKKVTAGEIPYSIKKQRKIVLSELSGVEEMKRCNGTLIGIFMTPRSVHRNRVPLSGKVLFQKHHTNKVNFSMARKFVETFMNRQMEEHHPENEYILQNERMTTAIQTDNGTYYVNNI
jgi:phosphatidylserine decarboxylase